MSFGAQILNEFGEVVLQMDKAALYAYSTGTTDDFGDVLSAGAAAAISDGYGTYFGWVTQYTDRGTYTVEFHTYGYSITQVAAGPGTYTEVVSSPAKVLVHPGLVLDTGDLIFYDVSTSGLLVSYLMMNHGYSDNTPNGGFGVCEVEGNANISFTVVSTREPVTSPPDGFGMQIFDASSNRLFDSRQDLFEIYDHFWVDKNIMKKILTENLTFDLNLSESHSSYQISAPNHTSFITCSGGFTARVMIKKVDNDTIRLSRDDNGEAETGDRRRLFWDTLIIVGR